ncbi:hypothetical protein ACFULT_26420 [Rhodococcus sp. NPDC057297]
MSKQKFRTLLLAELRELNATLRRIAAMMERTVTVHDINKEERRG